MGCDKFKDVKIAYINQTWRGNSRKKNLSRRGEGREPIGPKDTRRKGIGPKLHPRDGFSIELSWCQLDLLGWGK